MGIAQLTSYFILHFNYLFSHRLAVVKAATLEQMTTHHYGQVILGCNHYFEYVFTNPMNEEAVFVFCSDNSNLR